MKRTLATFMRIAFEATLHRILHAICAKILFDFAIQNHEKMLLRGFFLWLALWSGFLVVPDRSGSFPDDTLALPWEPLGSLGALLGALGSPLERSRGALGVCFFHRTPGPFYALGGRWGAGRVFWCKM